MPLSERIIPHLPYLRRFARAIAGSQYWGDVYVAATLETLIQDIALFPQASSDRVGLCKLLVQHFSSAEGSEVGNKNQAVAGFGSIAAAHRALLSIGLDGFNEAETMEILGITEDELHTLP